MREKLKAILLWSGKPLRRWRRYLLTAGLPLSLIWAAIIGYVTLTPPSYISAWTLILPGAGAGASVNLENIGQASSVVSSPFASSQLSPKVIYKSIAESDNVLAEAAGRLDMALQSFGRPRIKLIDQTALILFEVQGNTAESAQAKSWALYEAFEDQLDSLRRDEIAARAEAVRESIGDSEAKLNQARQSLLTFQEDTKLVSLDQFNELVVRLEALRQARAQASGSHERMKAEVEQLARSLKVDPALASAALTLEADPAFVELSREYAEATRDVAGLNATLGPNHPRIVNVRAREQAAKAVLLDLVGRVTGGADEELLRVIALVESTERASLFERLITHHAEQSGLKAQLEELDRTIAVAERQLAEQSGQAAKLDDLQRDHQITEAVFSSALARVETGRADTYASYPLAQMLASPSLPTEPSGPKKLLAIAGGVAGSLFWLLALGMLWIRKPLLQRISKSI